MSEPNMNDAIIVPNDLSIGYNGRPVLSGISLAIGRDSFTAVLGANGSGKSTLLKTVLGLLPPVAGRIGFASGGAARLRLRPPILSTRSHLSADGLRRRPHGHVRPLQPGRFIPASERAFTRRVPAVGGADEFARQAVCRAFRRPEAARAHRPGPGDAARHPCFGRTHRGRRPRGVPRRTAVHCADPRGEKNRGPPRHARFRAQCAGTPGRSSGFTTARCSRATHASS